MLFPKCGERLTCIDYRVFDSSWCTGSKCSAATVFNDELRKLLDGCDIDKILEILSDYSDMNGVKSI